MIFLESFLVTAISKYYYDNISQLLNKQGIISSNFYAQYLYDKDVQDASSELLETFSKNTTAQVQIINKNGMVLEDSSFLDIGRKPLSSDVDKALKGTHGSVIAYSKDTDESIMAVSYPLLAKGEVAGVIRYVTTLENVNKTISDITIVLILVSLIILIFIIIISLFLSSSITKPISKMTIAAEKMAQGEFNTRVTIHNRDEIGRLADTLNFMAGEITRSEQLKNDFVSSISHEIRTPLTSIKGWTVTLKTGDLEDKQEILDGLEIIERESDRLTSLVEELLDFSKFEAGKITLNMAKIDLVHLLNYVKRHLNPRAIRQHIDFTLKVENSFPLIEGDENRLKQVLINVLDNAFKFTPENGSIKITLINEITMARILIEDTGIGIDPQDLSKVTQMFYKGKESKYGSGIGLSISKQILDLHNATMEIESEVSKGTKITILLPIKMD